MRSMPEIRRSYENTMNNLWIFGPKSDLNALCHPPVRSLPQFKSEAREAAEMEPVSSRNPHTGDLWDANSRERPFLVSER